jgi:hypothetical protein
MDRVIKNQVDSWIENEKAAKADAKLQREYSAWLRRRVDRITIRINDGSNQCQPPQVWLVLGQRLAA